MSRACCRTVLSAVVLVLTLWGAAAAQQGTSITGVVVDALGGRISGATITLLGERGPAGETRSREDGSYSFENVPAGRYQVLAQANGFDPFTTDPVYVATGARATRDVTLQVGALRQGVTVTASASEVLQSQTGAPVTVLDATTLDALNKPELFEALRLVPGAQVVQTGARGATAALFIRGGNSNFNKVLVDGIPVNDIGGGFDFAQIPAHAVERVEVLRQANSVIYGSDALAGVVNITTRRGRSRVPELEYSLDGGNLGTVSTDLSFGGAVRRFDYFASYSRFETDNDVPNNGFENGTFAARFGVAIARATDLSGSIRRIDSEVGLPNAFANFRIADDSSQAKDQTYLAISSRSQWTDRWQSTVRFGWTDEQWAYVNPTPTGTPVDPFGFGANYLGQVVTLTGANGFSVTGRGILDFGGSYPVRSESRTARQLIAGDTTVQLHEMVAVSGGARFEHEEGYSDPDGEPIDTRNNGGAFVEGRATLGGRHYISAGVGYERNEVFDSAVTPRLSVASYLRQPTAAAIGDTKVTLNAGTGIKAPSVFQGSNSLYALVQGTPAAARAEPVGPERSRSFDIGVEQGFWGGDVRARIAYFRNTFNDLLEFLDQRQLTLAGVPPDVAAATAFGAYLNSQSYRAQGVELSGEAIVLGALRLSGSYTFLDAEVTEAFSASAAENPAFPGVEIGAFSPLVGERPFRRPTHSGTLMVSYTRDAAQVTLSGYFAGKRDDSTFLSDEFFGNSLLLPNRDLAAAYQKFDVAGSYQVHPRLRGYVSIENLFNQDYQAAFGFPSLPLTARAGFRVSLGGDNRP
jgi:iron complex outermembrane receptor protein/vitamin B12 transporter